MTLETDEESCKLFSATLTALALSWFQGLRLSTIGSFQDLVELFITHFINNKKFGNTISTLLVTKQVIGESLQDFVARFRKILMSVEGINAQSTAIAFRGALVENNLL